MEEKLMHHEDRQADAAPAEKKNPFALASLTRGEMKLTAPLRARSQDVTVLQYDFGALTGWEYAEAMDADPEARSVFKITAKQAMCLFAMAAAKKTPDIDAVDIRQRLGVADAVKAVQIATLFLVTSAREASRSSSGE